MLIPKTHRHTLDSDLSLETINVRECSMLHVATDVSLIIPLVGSIEYAHSGSLFRLAEEVGLLCCGVGEVCVDYTFGVDSRIVLIRFKNPSVRQALKRLLGQQFCLVTDRDAVRCRQWLSRRIVAYSRQSAWPAVGQACREWIHEIIQDLMSIRPKVAHQGRRGGVDGLQRLIDTHNHLIAGCHNSVSIEDLARNTLQSRWNLHRTYRAAFGVAPQEATLRARLRLACQYLRDTEDGLIEVAENSGFGSRSALFRAFKRHLNMAPTEYRSAHNVQKQPKSAPSHKAQHDSTHSEPGSLIT